MIIREKILIAREGKKYPTLEEVVKILFNAGMDTDNVTGGNGKYTYKRSFYYPHGLSADKLAKQIVSAFKRSPYAATITSAKEERAGSKDRLGWWVVKFNAASEQ